MISETNTGIEAGEWFDRLPTDADRRIVTGVVAMAYRFELNKGDYEFDDRQSNRAGFLAVYATGSRSTAQEGPRSDIDILVAHNLVFGQGSQGLTADFMYYVDFELLNSKNELDWSDPERVRVREESGYVRAEKQETQFGYHCLMQDPVSSAVTYGIAGAGSTYRLPDMYNGQLPDTYTVGGRDHKAFVRYKSHGDMSALDLMLYKGWHSNADPTDEDKELARLVAEELGEPYREPQKNICGPKCRSIGLDEGPNQEKFEKVIDTDESGNELSRIPLYTFGDSEKKIYIPQIEEVVIREQEILNGKDRWKFRRSWLVSD